MARLIPPDSRERFVRLPEGRVRLLEGGRAGGRAHAGWDDRAGNRALPLLLIHGGGSDNAGISWYRTFSALGGARRVVALDLPGFGASREVAALGAPSAMADFTVRVAREVGIERAAVAGVSMGGDVALNVALRHPEFTAALVLVAPGGLAARVGGPATHFLAWLAAQLPDWVLVPLSRVANRFTGTVLKSIVEDPSTLPPQVVAEFVREARGPGAGMAYGRYNQATLGPTRLRNDVSSRVHQITAPTLLFHGRDDPMVKPVDSYRAAQAMVQARLVLVPDTGHWAQLEAHEAFAAEVSRFLAGVDGDRGSGEGADRS